MSSTIDSGDVSLCCGFVHKGGAKHITEELQEWDDAIKARMPAIGARAHESGYLA